MVVHPVCFVLIDKRNSVYGINYLCSNIPLSLSHRENILTNAGSRRWINRYIRMSAVCIYVQREAAMYVSFVQEYVWTKEARHISCFDGER